MIGRVVLDANDNKIVEPLTGGSDKDIYSTTETMTNKVWYNGKPLYRKVLVTASLPSSGVYTVGSVDTGATGQVVHIEGYLGGGSTVLPFNVVNVSGGSDAGVICYAEKHSSVTNIGVSKPNGTYTTYTSAVIVVEYYKGE